MYVLTVEVAETDSEAAAWALFEAGVGGLQEETEGTTVRLMAYGESEEEIGRYRSGVEQWMNQSGHGARLFFRQEDDLEWKTAWTRYLRQETLGDSFVLQPTWDDSPAPPDRTVLRFEPEMAFGVGSHPTTCLAAAAVERECRRRSGCRLLDVGTGTGVLAMIGALSGAGQVVGLDVDPTSLRAATQNAKLNGLERCRFLDIPVGQLTAVFDVVVANIELDPLLAIGEPLAERTASGGCLLLTGFLCDRTQDVERVFSRLGLRVTGVENEEPWALVSLSRG